MGEGITRRNRLPLTRNWRLRSGKVNAIPRAVTPPPESEGSSHSGALAALGHAVGCLKARHAPTARQAPQLRLALLQRVDELGAAPRRSSCVSRWISASMIHLNMVCSLSTRRSGGTTRQRSHRTANRRRRHGALPRSRSLVPGLANVRFSIRTASEPHAALTTIPVLINPDHRGRDLVHRRQSASSVAASDALALIDALGPTTRFPGLRL
jgi:hypothetical protein